MEYFEDDEEKVKLKKERDLYIQNKAQTQKKSFKSCVITFSILCVVFVVIGIIIIVLGNNLEENSIRYGGYSFIGLGFLYIILIFILALAGKNENLEKAWEGYQKRKNKGIINMQDLYYNVTMLDMKVAALEKENSELKDRIRRIEQK